MQMGLGYIGFEGRAALNRTSSQVNTHDPAAGGRDDLAPKAGSARPNGALAGNPILSIRTPIFITPVQRPYQETP